MNDLFDELGDIFKPHFRKFEDLHDELVADIKRRIKRELMEATTIDQVDEIKAFNSDYLKMWPELLADFESATKRLQFIAMIRKQNWPISELN